MALIPELGVEPSDRYGHRATASVGRVFEGGTALHPPARCGRWKAERRCDRGLCFAYHAVDMVKAGVINRVTEEANLEPPVARRAVEALFENLCSALERDHSFG